jgi:NO-binding membrane sensor protein with MHYT domain
MHWEFSFNPPPPVPTTVNAFFVVLSFAVAMLGSFSALQFAEAMVNSALHGGKGRSVANRMLNIASVSFSVATLTIWLMHYTAIISISHPGYPLMFSLGLTIASMVAIFAGTLFAIVLLTFHKTGLFGDPDNHNEFIQLYHSRPKDTAPLSQQLFHLLRQVRCLVLSPRLYIGGAFVGLGVWGMHFMGMMSMRNPFLAHYYHPVMIGLCLPIGVVAGSAALVLLFTCHGTRRRLVATVVLGLAVEFAHWYGYWCSTISLAPPEMGVMVTDGELLVDAEVCCVVVMLIASLMRFVLMGMVYE